MTLFLIAAGSLYAHDLRACSEEVNLMQTRASGAAEATPATMLVLPCAAGLSQHRQLQPAHAVTPQPCLGLAWQAVPDDETSGIYLVSLTTGAVRSAPWISARTSGGAVFFANLLTKRTQWLPPETWSSGWIEFGVANARGQTSNSLVGAHAMLRHALPPCTAGSMVEGGSAYAGTPRRSPPAPATAHRLAVSPDALELSAVTDARDDASADAATESSDSSYVTPSEVSSTADSEMLTMQSVGMVCWDDDKGCLLEKSTNRVIEEIVDTIFCPTTGAFVHTMVTGYRVLMTTL